LGGIVIGSTTLYNTLKESRLGFWAVVEPVAYFAIVNTSIFFYDVYGIYQQTVAS
jgi:hypothetical protein